MELIRSVFVVIGGHGQTGTRSHGSNELAGKLREEYHDDERVKVYFESCDADFVDLASRINNLTGSEEPFIVVAGFSHGVGQGLTNCAAAFDAFDWKINEAILCDPICFGAWWYMLAIWLFRWFWPPHYRLPANVDWWSELYQRVDRPRGHAVLPTNKSSERRHSIELHLPHTRMDDSKEYHKLVLEAATWA